jgi:hypothetical protein
MTTLQQTVLASPRRATDFFAELVELVRALRAPFDSYRPERHYMRGPGPRWHAKHSPARDGDRNPC